MKSYQKVLLGLFAIMAITGCIGINIVPVDVSRQTHAVETSDGETISFNLYVKQGIPDNRPVIVMGHGVMVNKEMMTNYAIELASRNFIVANIDWRGHGQSTGNLDTSLLDLDLEAVISKIPLLVPSANMSELGLIGYSMGGGPTFRYAANHPEVKAWIGVGTNADGDISTETNPNNLLLI